MAIPTTEFVYHTTYKTVTGQVLSMPPLMSRQEEQLSESVAQIIREVPELAELFQTALRSEKIDFELASIALTKALRAVPDEARKIVSVLVGKDEEWVRDNLTIRGDYLPLIMTAWNEIYHGFSDAFEIVAEHFGDFGEPEGADSEGD